jgi:two-component system, chemotaxis family, protein-glutamate methylesterase/glutaminase
VIRVLVVDDSYFMRKILKEIISNEPDMNVVGEAANGAEAVGLVLQLKPDVITMDYNMPKMNGEEAVKQILNISKEKKPAILMISAYTHDDSSVSVECLRAGAIDIIAKPSGELSLDLDLIAKEILSKIRAASKAHIKIHEPVILKEYKESEGSKISNNNKTEKVIAIGASTGGPPEVENIVRSLPEKFDFTVIIVQHMPAFFTRSFSKRLNKSTYFTIKEAEDNELIKEGTVYFAPGGYHLVIEKNSSQEPIFKLKTGDTKHGLLPEIDTTMESVSKIFGENVLGIELTGMGTDGAEGMKAIKDAGGYVLVQDPSTAVIENMPMSVINNNAADEILKPEQIIKKVAHFFK